MLSKRILLFLLGALLITGSVLVTFPFKAYAVNAPKCHDPKPSDTPRIRKIYIKPDHAILYFTSVERNNTYYFISYGFALADERFGVQFPFGADSDHWVRYAINHLSPNTTYYFKVRGGNGCKPGNWSTWVKAITPKTGHQIYTF